MSIEKVAVYCRVSSESQDENFSIQVQQKRGREWGKSSGFEPIIFSDVFTGATIERPEFSKLLKRIQSGEIRNIWVIEFTRLTRNTQDAIILFEIFRSMDIGFYINGEKQHLSGPDNFLRYGIQSILADYEKQRILERFKRGADERRRTGGRWCSNLPYGYREAHDEKGNRVIEENEGEAKIVRHIFSETLRGIAAKQIAKELTEYNIKEVRGKRFWDATVARIIRNRIYCGEYIFEDKIVESTVYPHLVDKEDWEEAQDLLKRRNLKYHSRYNHNQCSSIFHCEHCGNPMIFHDKKSPTQADPENRRKQYKINHKNNCDRDFRGKQNIHPKEYLDEFMDFLFTRFVYDKSSIIAHFRREREKRTLWEDTRTEEKTRLEKALKEVSREKNTLLDILMKVGADADINMRIVQATKKQKSLELDLRKLNDEVGQSRKELQKMLDAMSHDLMEEYFQEGKATPYHKRVTLQKYIEKGVVRNQEFYLRWITGQEVIFDLKDIYEYNEVGPEDSPGWLSKFGYDSEEVTGEEAEIILGE